MNILIIGLGVIGSTYGFLFKQAGHHVEHYLRNESHKKGIKQLSVSLLDGRMSAEGIQTEGQYDIALCSKKRYDLIFVSVAQGKILSVMQEIRKEQFEGTLLICCNLWLDRSTLDRMTQGYHYILGFPVAGGRLESGGDSIPSQAKLDACVFDHFMLENVCSAKIANGTEIKFKFLRTVAGWSMQTIKLEYINLDSYSEPLIVADLIPFVRAVYKPLITVYYYGNNKIPKLIKEIYTDEAAYPECPKEKLSNFAKQAITEWLYIDTEIIKKLYPILMRMCSDSFDYYPSFFNSKAGEILKFVGLHKFDLLLPEKPKEPAPKENKPKVTPPQKGIKDETVITGLKLLNQMFPEAGFDNLDNHPDMFPYFQPLFKFKDGFNLLAPDNPVQVIVVLQHIIEDCFHGCHNIKFVETDSSKKGTDNITSIIDEWAAYREDTFEFLYCEPLCDLVNSTYSQPDFVKSHIGKRMITDLLWQVTYHFMPNFKFEKLILEHPVDESKYRPLFHRTDYARKYLTVLINEVDRQAKTRGKCNLIENPWEHYNFDIPNEISKRLDVLLGAQNRTANTNATNANLLKYTLCFIAVLDWFINNPESPAYSTDPMHIWRVSDTDGKPLFSVPLRTDQNKLFADAIRASYQKSAK